LFKEVSSKEGKLVEIELNTKQYQAWKYLNDKQTTELFYGGAAGGGKSFLGCLWILQCCQRYPETRWLIGRAKLKTLKETTLLTFFEVCKLSGYKADVHYKYNSQAGVITFKNGSQIYLMDLFRYPSDPEFDKLGSTEYTGAFVDEAAQISMKAKEILGSRIRYKLDEYGLIPKILLTSNPGKNFLYIQFYKPWRDGNIVRYRKFVRALVTDNNKISPHYVENLRKLRFTDRTAYERLFLGNFEYDDDPAKLMEYDKIVDIFTNSAKRGEDPDKFIVCDVARAGRDKAVIMYWEGLHIAKVWWFAKSKTRDLRLLMESIADRQGVPRSNIIIDDDGVGGGLVDEMPGVIGFINNKKQLYEGIPTNYSNLKTQCSYKMAEYVNKGKISCGYDGDVRKWIIEELEVVKRKNVGKDEPIRLIGKDDVKDLIGRSPDFSDCIMMRMLKEITGGGITVFFDKSGTIL